MRSHIAALGWLHIVLHGLYVVIGLILLLVFAGGGAILGATGGHDALGGAAALGGIGMVICLVFLIIGLPGAIIGWGILKEAPWARILGIVLSILNLLNFPIGTIIGGYGLWVLFNPETIAIFEGRQVQTYQ